MKSKTEAQKASGIDDSVEQFMEARAVAGPLVRVKRMILYTWMELGKSRERTVPMSGHLIKV